MGNAIVLLSGGLDSSTLLAVALSKGFKVSTLSFDYGQRHRSELTAARMISISSGVLDHLVIKIDLCGFGRSALTDAIDVPTNRSVEEMNATVPLTYVPGRNTIFLSYALALAEVREADDIFVGVNALDYGGYPDCRPEYIAAFQNMARLATARSVTGDRAVTVHAPLIQMTKAEIIRLGLSLGVEFSRTISCYQATENGLACGKCDACILRRQGFELSGFADPTRYIESEMVTP
ncbi:MAG: 7-cyano-7-deazaguanine synthase QueC [Planctomycetaceae bacterium]